MDPDDVPASPAERSWGSAPDSVRPASGGRDQGLFAAVVAVAAGLELTSTLRRIVQAAVELSDARYGALGVVGDDDRVREFIHVGMDPDTVEAIGDYPRGLGVLGLLVQHPVPLRIDEISAHAASAGFPQHHPPMTSFLGVPVRVRGRVFGNLYLTDKRGAARFTAEDEHTVTALAAAAAVAIENARLFEHTRMRGRWQAAITDLNTAVLGGAETEEVLGLMARKARVMTSADVAAVALPSDDAFVVEIVDDGDGAARGGLLGAEWTTDGPDAGSVAGVGSGVVLPLRTPEQTLGLLWLGWADPEGALETQARERAENFAGQAAVTVALAQARREQERLMVYEDRDRIARDLHDLVIQRLFATGMQLQATSRIPGVSEDLTARIDRAVDELDETIREIRQTIFALHEPMDAPGAGLRSRVLREVEQSAALLGFSPTVRFVGPVDSLASAVVAENLTAVLREALTNAARHARARRVDVMVEASDGDLVLTVTDDGVGLPESGRRSGLSNIEDRARAVGGSSVVERISADGGTRLRWSAPA